MKLEELLRRRIIVLSGKGGVGKSILTAALAWIAFKAGKRVLIVELDTIVTVPHFFGISRLENYKETRLHDNIYSLHVDGKSALEEYLGLVLKSRKLTERIFRSPIYQYFVEVAPGLKELMTIGKIWNLEQEKGPGGNSPKYDLLIIDTPATGHTSSYFRMPQTAATTMRRGFVKKEAQKVVDLLQDPEKVAFNVVTTLEEMPVNEALDLYHILADQLHLPIGCIFANKTYPRFPGGNVYKEYLEWKERVLEASAVRNGEPARDRDSELLLLVYAESWRKRRGDSEFYMEKLKKTTGCDIHPVPFLFSTNVDLGFIQELAQGMISESSEVAGIEAQSLHPSMRA